MATTLASSSLSLAGVTVPVPGLTGGGSEGGLGGLGFRGERYGQHSGPRARRINGSHYRIIEASGRAVKWAPPDRKRWLRSVLSFGETQRSACGGWQ